MTQGFFPRDRCLSNNTSIALRETLTDSSLELCSRNSYAHLWWEKFLLSVFVI